MWTVQMLFGLREWHSNEQYVYLPAWPCMAARKPFFAAAIIKVKLRQDPDNIKYCQPSFAPFLPHRPRFQPPLLLASNFFLQCARLFTLSPPDWPACPNLAAPRTIQNATSVFNEAYELNEKYDTSLSSSTHRCCAERRLLDSWVAQARRHGVPSHKVVSWIRRKIGSHISVIRYRSDGTHGCTVPCIFCQKELLKYDIRVHCLTATGSWFSGRLTDDDAPKSVLTAGQRRMFKRDIRREPGTTS